MGTEGVITWDTSDRTIDEGNQQTEFEFDSTVLSGDYHQFVLEHLHQEALQTTMRKAEK
jgi:hypothetical protein